MEYRKVTNSGPLLTKDLKPEDLDYDNNWDEDIKAHNDLSLTS